jgi:hypothetical protein
MTTPARMDLDAVDPETLATLIERGMAHIQLAADNQPEQPASRSLDEQVNLSSAEQQLRELENRPGQLWKRMFEIEEDFPAPVDTPRKVRGVSPW